MKPPRGAVIGKGSMGVRHFRILQKTLPEAEHRHIGSREFDAHLAEQPTDEFPPTWLANVSFVVVASPSTRHYRHLVELSRYGLPILVEKPLASRFVDATDLAACLNNTGVLAQVGYVLRFSEAFGALNDNVSHRGLDAIESVTITAHSYLPDWRPNTDFREGVSARADLGGGVLRELSHELDYVLNVVGPLTVLSATLTQSQDISHDVDTGALIRAETGSRAPVTISLDMANPTLGRSCDITWQNGERLRWDLLKNSLTVQLPFGKSECRHFADTRDDWYQKQLLAFLAAVDEQIPPSPSVEEALNVMACIDTIEKIAGCQQ